MKLLIFLILLFAPATIMHAQDVQPKYVGVYYKVSGATIAYGELIDTTGIIKSPIKPISVAKGSQFLVVAWPDRNWAQGVKAGTKYYIRSKYLAQYEKPAENPSPAAIEAERQRVDGNTDRYHNMRVGPRGGHYYINSNGNKTYIKRK